MPRFVAQQWTMPWVLTIAWLVSAPTDGTPRPGEPRVARAWPAPSDELRAQLDAAISDLRIYDPALSRARLHVTLIDLTTPEPRMAHHDGASPFYPASLVKLVYAFAAFAWAQEGRLTIDAELSESLREMIVPSSNRATQRVVARITGTEPGPHLDEMTYAEFRDKRFAVNRWLAKLGIRDLHCVHPTFNGDGDISDRDRQLLMDESLRSPTADETYPNRQSATANGLARLLWLVATQRVLDAQHTRAALSLMRRDPEEQPYQAQRIAGGALRVAGVEVFSKSGTWGPLFADAGVIWHRSGRRLILVVAVESTPPYRGDFVADLAERMTSALLCQPDGCR